MCSLRYLNGRTLSPFPAEAGQKNQLDAFQLALWFMHKTRAFVILQMRDETYERYKNQPPLDTFRTGITFHITPPRFLDVVKKRLELTLEYLAAEAKNRQAYTVESGARVTCHKSDLQDFLHGLYVELFDRKRNRVTGWQRRAPRTGDVRQYHHVWTPQPFRHHIDQLEPRCSSSARWRNEDGSVSETSSNGSRIGQCTP